MSEYIEREAAIEAINGINWYKLNDDGRLTKGGTSHDKMFLPFTAVKETLKHLPAADVRPVVHTKTENALDMVRAERDRQNSLWGDQSNNHPFEWMSILGEEYGELCEAVNETCFQNGTHPERGGRDKIIKEAAHIAAVAVAIIEANCGADMRGEAE